VSSCFSEDRLLRTHEAGAPDFSEPMELTPECQQNIKEPRDKQYFSDKLVFIVAGVQKPGLWRPAKQLELWDNRFFHSTPCSP